MVKVATKAHGLILVEPAKKLYKNHLCLAGAGIAQVEPNKPFTIVVANFGKHPVILRTDQRVATAEPPPTTILESNLTMGEVFNIESEDPTGQPVKHRKRNVSARDAKIINRHLANNWESHMDKDETPTTADDIPLPGVPPALQTRVRDMLRKHEKM